MKHGIGILGCLSLSLVKVVGQEPPARKNVLFIMADDFNHWTRSIGYYPQSYTPNIDRLGAMGVLFTDAHCSSPVSNPSRNALWSGYRPSTTGIDNNAGGFVRDVPGFSNIRSLHQYFKELGYHVYGSGKLWHPGRMDPANPSCDPANWSQINQQATGCNGGSYSRWESDSNNAFVWSGNPNTMTQSNCNDFALASQVASFITSYSSSPNQNKPFFIACGFFRPHLPFNSPVQFWNLFSEDTLNIPKGYLENDLADISGANSDAIHNEIVAENKWKEGIRAYLASMALADFNVGILLDALENSPYRDNTIVLFMGDHGWHLGEKDRWSKYAVYDQANRTTLVIYDPSSAGNGNKCSKVVSLQDIYPTLVELCGLPPKTDIEGRSLKPLLENPDKQDWNWPVLMTYSGKNYIKTNNFRFVDDGTKSQLYNVQSDPHEWINLFGKPEYNETINRLKQQIDSIRNIGFGLKEKLLAGYSFIPEINVIPGIIEAENYDEGAEGQVYHDTDNVNSGGHYRLSDGVDIEVTNDSYGAFNITDTRSGEWLTYTIASYEKGNYDITIRACNPSPSSSTITLYMNDTPMGSFDLAPNNPEWSDVKLNNIEISGTGFLRFRVVINTGGAKLNYFRFVKSTSVSVDLIVKDNGGNRFLIDTVIQDSILQIDLTQTNPTARLEIFSLAGIRVEVGYVIGESIINYRIKSNLNTGYYYIRISDGVVDRTEKFLKL